MVPGLLMIIGLAAASEAADAVVHRCRDPQGQISFQDRACGAGREDPGWDAAAFSTRVSTPSGKDAAAARKRQQALERREQSRWEAASRRRLAPSLGGPVPAAPGSGSRMPAAQGRAADAADACDRARQARDRAVEHDWMRLGFDQRSQLDAAVRANCADQER